MRFFFVLLIRILTHSAGERSALFAPFAVRAQVNLVIHHKEFKMLIRYERLHTTVIQTPVDPTL